MRIFTSAEDDPGKKEADVDPDTGNGSRIPRPKDIRASHLLTKTIDLWITSLLFDLNYKFINGTFAFSPG